MIRKRSGRKCSNSQRPRAPDHSSAEQAKRLEYLEKIVKGYVGSKDALDLETLKGLAQAAEKRRNSPRPVDTSSQSSEFEGVDDKFEIRPLHGNVTRTNSAMSILPASWMLTLTFRLFWRVFSLEFFNADQEMDRSECSQRRFKCEC